MPKNDFSLLMNSLAIPKFDTLDEFSKITGLSSRLLFCLSMLTERYYKAAEIPKRNGTPRKIYIPSYTLHIVQRWILNNILNKLLPSGQAMAFRSGRKFGHKANALYHSESLYGISLDLKDFFPSITANKIYTVFANIGYNNFAATILTNLCTLDGKLPQGSACSPALSNIVCISLDKRLIGLCEKRGIRFTRYADDMYFSCDNKALLLKILPAITKIITDENFVINEKKTQFHTPKNRKQVTGVTIATLPSKDKIELKAPKQLKRKVRAEILNCLISGNYENKDHILGEISYIAFIEKENANIYDERIRTYIKKTAQKIRCFYELVQAYNENLFFKDLCPIEYEKIDFANITDPDEYREIEFIFEDRERYLNEHNIKDVCFYSDWPSVFTKSSEEFIKSGNQDEDAPF